MTKEYNVGDLVDLGNESLYEYLGDDFNVGTGPTHLYRPIVEWGLFKTLEEGRIDRGRLIGGCVPICHKALAYRVFYRSEHDGKEDCYDYKIGEIVSVNECDLLYLGEIEMGDNVWYVYYPIGDKRSFAHISYVEELSKFREGSIALLCKLKGVKKYLF